MDKSSFESENNTVIRVCVCVCAQVFKLDVHDTYGSVHIWNFYGRQASYNETNTQKLRFSK